MKELYLITGAAGHLGSVLTEKLKQKEADIRALVLPGEAVYVPEGVTILEGDVTDEASLVPFFDRTGYDHVTLFHCAALISIASRKDRKLWDVNVNGTRNVMQAALRNKVERVIYVSSVHAIPIKPKPQVMTETDTFSPNLVIGQYARTKAEAANLVLAYAREGLNVSIVHPTGIIGPGDKRRTNHMVTTIMNMAEGSFPVSTAGGYDFVDARDVADGMLGCEKKGGKGECYILSGHFITITELMKMVARLTGRKAPRIEIPYGLTKLIAPLAEGISRLSGEKRPLFTPYSMYTLHSNSRFSHEKATKAFGYEPRPLEETIQTMLAIYAYA